MRTMQSPSWIMLLAALAGLLTSVAVLAAEPLSGYVERNAALYIELSRLDADWTSLENSPLAERWQQTALARHVQSMPFMQRWSNLDHNVEQKTGQTLTHHLRQMFAQSVALAVYLPDSGEPQALLLARGESAMVMQETIATWNRVESQVQVKTKTWEGREYFQRTVGQTTAYYALVDDLFLLSDQESLVKNSLEISTQSHTPDALATDETFQAAWPDTVPAGSLVAYAAPRRWDPVLETIDDQSPFANRLKLAWRSVSSATLRLTVNSAGPAADIQLALDPEKISEGWKQWCSSSGTSATIWQGHLPADAILAIGGRSNPEPVVQGLKSIMPERDRQEWERTMRVAQSLLLNQDPWSDIGKLLLHDWGLYFVVRSPADQSPLRSHPFVAVWTSYFPPASSSLSADGATIQECSNGLKNAIGFGLNLLLVGVNSQPQGGNASLQVLPSVEEMSWTFTGRPEAQLAISLSDSLLQISTSVQEWQSQRHGNGPLADQTPMPPAAAERLQDSSLGVWINLGELRRQRWANFMRRVLAPAENSRQAAHLESLESLSELFDGVDLTADWSRTEVHLHFATAPREVD